MPDSLSRTPIENALSRLDATSIIAACVIAVAVCLLLRSYFRSRRRGRTGGTATITDRRLGNPAEQMRFVEAVAWETQPLLNKSEYPVLLLLESVAREVNGGFRVMAQTSLGEVLRPIKTLNEEAEQLAYASINSKRVDFVIIDRTGRAVVAVEYQGTGHYQGTALQRDAIKREAFQKANVAFIEVSTKFDSADVARAVRSILVRHAGSRPPLASV